MVLFQLFGITFLHTFASVQYEYTFILIGDPDRLFPQAYVLCTKKWVKMLCCPLSAAKFILCDLEEIRQMFSVAYNMASSSGISSSYIRDKSQGCVMTV